MAIIFSQTTRSLDADRSRRSLIFPALVILISMWLAWMWFGRISVYVVTDRARLEVNISAHPVASQVAGRVIETNLSLGREVAAGVVLVLLEAELERLEIEEKQAELTASTERRTSLLLEIASEREAMAAQLKAREGAKAEAQALVVESEARSRFMDYQAASSSALRKKNVISEEVYLKDRAEAEAQQAHTKSMILALRRGENDRLVQESERRSNLAKLERQRSDCDGEALIIQAKIRKLQHEIDLRSIRAPVAGKVGEASEVRPGSVVRAEEKLGMVIPAGEPRVVAHFPVGASGRIVRGQPARIRLEGFSWMQYGSLRASVAEVGSEPNAGRIRVELSLLNPTGSKIPLEHGLPGTVEIEVEQVSPLLLLLRASGQFLGVRPNRSNLGADANAGRL